MELESVYGFGPNPVYVAYYALASPGWKLLNHCTASAVTQTSSVSGQEQRAVFCFPIELAVESETPPNSPAPPLSIFFSVVSRDAHERMTQLGYAHISPPAEAGASMHDVGAWGVAESRTDALRRFFVGGSEELHDLRAINMPEGFDRSQPGAVLNKHGLHTVTAGILRVRIQTIVQQQQPPVTSKPSAKKADGAASRPQFRKPPPEMGSLKGILSISTLARSETAVDRVKKRLEERRRTEERGLA